MNRPLVETMRNNFVGVRSVCTAFSAWPIRGGIIGIGGDIRMRKLACSTWIWVVEAMLESIDGHKVA